MNAAPDPIAAFLHAAGQLGQETGTLVCRHGVALGLPPGRGRRRPPGPVVVGVLTDADGSEFAELRAGRSAASSRAAAGIEELTRLLHAAREAEAAERAADAAPADGEADPETGLGGGAVWERFSAGEARRADRFAHPCSVLLVDADSRDDPARAGRAAQALRGTLRAHDLLCLSDDRNLAVLAVECPAPVAPELARRARSALLSAGVHAALGFAGHRPDAGPARAGLAAALAGARRGLVADRAGHRVAWL